MTLYAHLLPLSRATQDRTRDTASQQTAGQQSLQSTPAAEPTGAEPGSTSVSGVFGGAAAAELATALAELGNPADEGFRTVPIYAEGTREGPVEDGYYTLQRVRTQPEQPSATGPLARYELGLERVGTRQSQWRAVETAPIALESDFATGESPTVAIPTGQADRWWFDAASGGLEPASPTTTVATAGGDVDVFDPTAASVSEPTLLYDVDYAVQPETDCVLWDRYGSASKTGVDGIVQWRPVYSRAHEPRGALVASTRRFRLVLDAETGLLGAESYSNGSWSDVSLGQSSWTLSLVDITGLDPAVLQLQCWFSDGDGVYTLNARLRRGADGVVWSIPPNEQPPTPPGLVDLLDPTATDSYEVAGATTTTRARSEVRL